MDWSRVVGRQGRIVVEGPLAPFTDGLREDLASQGFAVDTIVDHVHRLAGLSGWLSARGLAPAELTSEVAQEFVRVRRAAGVRVGVSERALAPLLGYLRRLGIVPLPAAAVATTPVAVLLAEYHRFLEDERGLAAGTVKQYLRCARTFLTWLPGPLERALPRLDRSSSSCGTGPPAGAVRRWTW